MPVGDRYHENLKHALIKDSWIITHDPFRLVWGKKDLYIDMGRGKMIKAEKDCFGVLFSKMTPDGNFVVM